MPKLNQRGVTHIFLIVFLLAGLAVAVYLVQQKTNIFPRASVSGPISSPAPSVPVPVSGGEPGQTETVVRPPSDVISFNVSPNASCSFNNLTASVVSVAWLPVMPPINKAELDVGTGLNGEPDIRIKEIKPDETITYAPVGFSGTPEIVPGQKYYIRLYNGQYSEIQSFTIPSCMYYPR
ncbi:hypothetical protein KKE03_03670 [Patescibacteria group bacterium]|nr:hypothetical protein [Patescibacteria group bacterium]